MTLADLRTELLTDEERETWEWICANISDDDAEPNDVVTARFGGDFHAYLKRMAAHRRAVGSVSRVL